MRYFIVFFRKLHEDNSEAFGNISLIQKTYPCCFDIMNQLGEDKSVKAAAITGINEVRKDDLVIWIAPRKL